MIILKCICRALNEFYGIFLAELNLKFWSFYLLQDDNLTLAQGKL